MNKDKETPNNEGPEKGLIQPDPETLNSADPQEEMKGPLSSLGNAAADAVDDISELPPNDGRNDGKE